MNCTVQTIAAYFTRRRRLALAFLATAAAAASSACSTVTTYDNQFRSVYSAYRSGDVEKAIEVVTDKSHRKKLESNDRLLWTMETGKLFHAAGRFEESNRYFERAEAILADYESRAEFTVRGGAAEAGALFTNPAAIPYRGTWTDRIMINTYKALNYLALSDLQAARVEIRRAYERQQEALDQNRKAIREAEKEASESDFSLASIQENPVFENAARIDPTVAQAYADFSNPFTTLLSGLIALADRDPARAEVDFRLLASLPLPNRFIEAEFARIQDYLNGENPSALHRPRVYVLFENGLGPNLQEMRVDLILPDLGYTGFAFPELVSQPSPVSALRAGGHFTAEVASMDQIVATEFRARMPGMIARTVSSVIAKEVLAKQLTDDWDLAGLLIGSLYKAVVNRADTRTWKTLGKEFQFAAFDYPADGTLQLALAGYGKNEPLVTREVTLPEGDFVLVLARSVNEHDLRVATSVLR